MLKNIEELGISLSDENLKKVLDRVVKLGDSKETITPDDLPFIIADALESSDYHHIHLENCEINSSFGEESVVKLALTVNGTEYAEEGHGNGGFSAFIDALKKILAQIDFTLPELTDYAIRIPKGGKPGALTECTITWDVEGMRGRKLRTRGVHANQVYAAVLATLRMVNTRLHSQSN